MQQINQISQHQLVSKDQIEKLEIVYYDKFETKDETVVRHTVFDTIAERMSDDASRSRQLEHNLQN